MNHTALQLSGPFFNDFWQRAVIQLSLNDPAILHAVCALGALHESILQGALRNTEGKDPNLKFALTQCNVAIHSLTRKMPDGTAETANLSCLVLVACILFANFEAMQGDLRNACAHASQGRNLLDHCRMMLLARNGANDGLLDRVSPSFVATVSTLKRAVEQLEMMARTFPVGTEQPPYTPEEPLPDDYRITSLQDAHDSLLVMINSFTLLSQDIYRQMALLPSQRRAGTQSPQPRSPYPLMAAADFGMHGQRGEIARSLQRWGEAFAAFLARQEYLICTEDFHRARILKANQLSTLILASLNMETKPPENPFAPFMHRFREIVNLAAAVFESPAALPTISHPRFGFLAQAIWIYQPLYFVLARCPDPDLRRQAARLLLYYWRSGKALGREPPEDVVNGWMRFAAVTRMDVGMRVFGSRTSDLPPDAAQSVNSYE